MDPSPLVPSNVAAAAGSVPAPNAGEALPRAPVLSYLANVSTPTRVRTVAAGGVLVVAMGCSAAAVAIITATCFQVEYSLKTWMGPMRAYTEAFQHLGEGSCWDSGDFPVSIPSASKN